MYVSNRAMKLGVVDEEGCNKLSNIGAEEKLKCFLWNVKATRFEERKAKSAFVNNGKPDHQSGAMISGKAGSQPPISEFTGVCRIGAESIR
jgi:hypothetical protein